MKYKTMNDALTCVKGPLECIRYFPGQLITAAEMAQEQDYFRQKLRLHNRLLHGWGVVCGAMVCAVSETDENNGIKPKPWHVMVKPGYILGPYGDEIVIDCTHEVDLRTSGLSGVTDEACEQALDPWCSEVSVKRETGLLYIAVKYKQTLTRPVRVQPVGCGCETQCEYSRCRDGYEICILDECPENHRDPLPDVSHEALFGGPNPPCPECPADPWVVLAEVEVNEDGTIQRIDNCSCRRVVISFANKWWHCQGGQKYQIYEVNLNKEDPVQPGETREVEILGSWESLSEGITILFPGVPTNIISTKITNVTSGLITGVITNNGDEGFPSGSFVLEIVNRHGEVIASKRSNAKTVTKVSKSKRKPAETARKMTKKPDK